MRAEEKDRCRWLGLFLIILLTIVTTPALAQLELDSRFEPGTYCSEARLAALSIDPSLSCGETFYQVDGRLAFPLLYNHGPIRLEVLTLTADTRTRFPLYIGYLPRLNSTNLGCTTILQMRVLFVAHGWPIQCGGVWEAIGPINLAPLGVPLGEPYHIQLEGFSDLGGGSVVIAAIRVITEGGSSSVATTPWSNVKLMYRDATR